MADKKDSGGSKDSNGSAPNRQGSIDFGEGKASQAPCRGHVGNTNVTPVRDTIPPPQPQNKGKNDKT